MEDGSHIVLLALTYYLVANNSVWPKNYHLHYSQAIGMEDRQLGKITFCNSSASGHYNKEVRIQLWYKFTLILMLYCWNLSVFLSILKAFLAMPKWLLMSLCSFPTRLSVLRRYVKLSVVERSFPFALISVHCHYLRLLFVDLRADLFNEAKEIDCILLPMLMGVR